VELKPIETPADHEASLQEIERLWNAEEGTADGNRLEILMTMVDAYEETHFPMPYAPEEKTQPHPALNRTAPAARSSVSR
jgi:antitoxin component HigA of HigAB toxin-antitoxin module